MNRDRWRGVGALLIVGVLLGGCAFYVMTGGNGLGRVVWHYLIRDIPDKKYSWRDFTDRGVDQGISGFYAYGDQDGFSMWTLSGLKTFSHVRGTSIYMHEDICGAVQQLIEKTQEEGNTVRATKQITADITFWETFIKQENLVTVLRLSEGEYHNGINKVWSYSGIYKELNKLDSESCK